MSLPRGLPASADKEITTSRWEDLIALLRVDKDSVATFVADQLKIEIAA